jgi:DNA-binding NtrC family response regulator
MEVFQMELFSVLLVDDEEEFLETLTKRLKKRNVNVASAGDGRDALEFLSRNPVDVVVLDVRMPGMDGIEILRRIKESYPLTEVIMLTGHANLEVAVEGMELGAFDYLMKPVNIDDLLYKLQDAYKNKTIQEARQEEHAGPDTE